MELYVDIADSFLPFYSRKLIRIKNFEITISKCNDILTEEEVRMHVKFASLKQTSKTEVELSREDTKDKDKYRLKFKENEATEFRTALIKEKNLYDEFIKDYYTNNDSYNLIEGDSIFDYLQSIQSFLVETLASVETITIDPNLKQILDIQNKFLTKISYYTKMIDSNFLKLNPENEEEAKLIHRSDEIKTLLEELREVITSCTYGLTSDEIENYILNFKNTMKQKSIEITALINEIKYCFTNYLALQFENSEDKLFGEVFNSKEEEMARLMLENEQLKLQIENIDKENEMINQFLLEHNK